MMHAALIITGDVRGTPKKKLYQEKGFETLQQIKQYRESLLFI